MIHAALKNDKYLPSYEFTPESLPGLNGFGIAFIVVCKLGLYPGKRLELINTPF
jgi:hypothetical protein